MRYSRRDLIRKIALGGIAAANMPAFAFSPNPVSPSDRKKDGKGLTILFQGDSITHGNRIPGNDWNHVMGHSYAYLIACRLWFDHIDKNLMFYNRGVSGDCVRDLDARWQEDTLELRPDVLSIMVGVNDVGRIVRNQEPDPLWKFEEIYRRLLERTIKSLPDTRIVLCEPFILAVGGVKEKSEIWEPEMDKRQEVVRKLAADYDTVFIELQKPFNKACNKAPAEYWIWDGVHPMPAGHELIARNWINEMKSCLKI